MSTVLVVDDAPDIRAVVQRTLERRGDKVIATDNGADALELAKSTPFDIAIVDYNIPPPDGLEVLSRLRKLQPNSIRILISGALDVSVTLAAINRGEVSRVLRKPFDGGALITTVEDALAMRERVGEQYVSSQSKDHVDEAGHLRECFEGDVLQLAVQPIVRSSDRTVAAHEALLRSTHPILTGPLPVVRAAERQALVAPLGALVARRAAQWLTRLPEETKLFINLHPGELADPEGLVDRLEPLKHCAQRVVLEITERSKVLDVNAWETSTRLLGELGFALAVDDLGAGYSSLSVLAELKPKFMKIDMSIIRNVGEDRHKQKLVALLCRFAKATGAETIAEGIETEDEAVTVVAAGATMLQGYLFGRPQLHQE